jgi:hypothetical protein
MTAFKAQKDLISLFLPPSLYTSRKRTNGKSRLLLLARKWKECSPA